MHSVQLRELSHADYLWVATGYVIMEKNLSVPIYSADGLWLQQPIYLLLWESKSERS